MPLTAPRTIASSARSSPERRRVYRDKKIVSRYKFTLCRVSMME
ncbi:MAG: hypothetical protein ACRENO_05935 [Thermodesulfobacteriota bacterium]